MTLGRRTCRMVRRAVLAHIYILEVDWKPEAVKADMVNQRLEAEGLTTCVMANYYVRPSANFKPQFVAEIKHAEFEQVRNMPGIAIHAYSEALIIDRV